MKTGFSLAPTIIFLGLGYRYEETNKPLFQQLFHDSLEPFKYTWHRSLLHLPTRLRSSPNLFLPLSLEAPRLCYSALCVGDGHLFTLPEFVSKGMSTRYITFLVLIRHLHLKAKSIPKLTYHKRLFTNRTKPKKLPRTLFGWIFPVLKTPESFVLHTLGLDAIMFLRFYKTCMYAFLAMSVFGLVVMIPINWAWEKESNVSYNVLMLTLNAQESTSNYIVAHIVAAYVNSIIGYFFLKPICPSNSFSLRWHFLLKARRSHLWARTIMFENLPRKVRGNAQLLRFAHDMRFGPVERVRVIQRDDESLLPKALQQRSDALKKLEAAYCHILGNPSVKLLAG